MLSQQITHCRKYSSNLNVQHSTFNSIFFFLFLAHFFEFGKTPNYAPIRKIFNDKYIDFYV